MQNNFDLAQYMAEGVRQMIKDALKASLRNPRETAFLLRFMKTAEKAETKREKMAQQGISIPPFLIASVTSACNLQCKGCYAHAHQDGISAAKEPLPAERWNELFTQAENLGIPFILLAGGEPMLRPDLLHMAAAHKNILFPLFTNGTLLGEGALSLLQQKRNILPVVSLEGSRSQTDARRGDGTYDRLNAALTKMRDVNLFYGVSITVTKENLETVLSDDFISELEEKGCKVVFYVEYVPADGLSENLAFTESERTRMETRLLALRLNHPAMLLLSFPGDEKETGGCLAAGRGFFHINPYGDAEPCPFSPYSDCNVRDHDLITTLQSPLFQKLQASGLLLGEHTGGCVLFQAEQQVKEMAEQ